MASGKDRQARIRQFDRQLKRLIAEELLIPKGFISKPHRYFLRTVQHQGTSTVQVVEFQIGDERLAGLFTVNLGVYNKDLSRPFAPIAKEEQIYSPTAYYCYDDLTKRLGYFVIPKQSLIKRILKRPPEAPSDYWWEQSADETKMVRTMQQVKELIAGPGMSWLEKYTCREAFEWAASRLEYRKRRKASGWTHEYVEEEFKGSPNMPVQATSDGAPIG